MGAATATFIPAVESNGKRMGGKLSSVEVESVETPAVVYAIPSHPLLTDRFRHVLRIFATNVCRKRLGRHTQLCDATWLRCGHFSDQIVGVSFALRPGMPRAATTSDIRQQQTLDGPSRTAPSYDAGTVIGDRYELVSVIGRGGFGEVWLAHNRLLDNDVALKLYAHDADPTAGERLRTEARAAAALEHPAIVRVFDVGTTAAADPYLVMELLNGENLEDVLRRTGTLSPRRALRVLLPVVDGIACAHAKGLIHRDIKLANVVLTHEGSRLQPKLIDFGLAKPVRGSSRITMRGELVGTPAYMSPEQANGDPVDARSDVWSMSVALYELLTGRVPFEAETVFEGLRAVRESEPAAIVPTGAIDAALVALVMKGLEKSPDARWPSMRALGIAMAKWLEAHHETEDVCGTSIRSAWLHPGPAALDPTPPPFPAYRPKRRLAIVAIAFAAIAFALVLAYAFRHHGLAPSPPPEAARDSPTIGGVRPSSTTPAPHATGSPVNSPRPVRIPPPPKSASDVF